MSLSSAQPQKYGHVPGQHVIIDKVLGPLDAFDVEAMLRVVVAFYAQQFKDLRTCGLIFSF